MIRQIFPYKEIIMNEEEYRNKLEKIQNIVPWQEEERVGYSECRNLGKLPTTTLSDIDNKSKKLPKDVDVFVVGGLADRGTTRHDIDVFILNKTDKSKDEIDLNVKQTFLDDKGRMFRVYNLDKFEKDMNYLKNIIDDFDRSDRQQREKLCEKLNPILEIHSHCKKDEKISDLRSESECIAKTPEETSFSNIYRCNKHGCDLIRIKK